jgi:hypothetical protein
MPAVTACSGRQLLVPGALPIYCLYETRSASRLFAGLAATDAGMKQ